MNGEHNFDEWVKKKLGGFEPPFDEKAWDAMNEQLDTNFDMWVKDQVNDYNPPFDSANWDKMENQLDGQFDTWVKDKVKQYNPPFKEKNWQEINEQLDERFSVVGFFNANRKYIIAASLLFLMWSFSDVWQSFYNENETLQIDEVLSENEAYKNETDNTEENNFVELQAPNSPQKTSNNITGNGGNSVVNNKITNTATKTIKNTAFNNSTNENFTEKSNQVGSITPPPAISVNLEIKNNSERTLLIKGETKREKTPQIVFLQKKENILIENNEASLKKGEPLSLPQKRKKYWTVGLMAGLDWNLAEQLENPQLGFSSGITIGRVFNKNWSLQTGVLYTRKAFYSEQISTPRYLKGQAKSLVIDYTFIEVPLSARYTFLPPNYEVRPYLEAGFSTYFPVKSHYIYTLEPYSYDFGFSDRVSSEYGSVSHQTSTTNNVAVVSSEDFLNTPDGNSTVVEPIWGIVNMQMGVSVKLRSRWTLDMAGLLKVSMAKVSIDAALNDFRLWGEDTTNKKRLLSGGGQIGLSYKF